MNNKNYWQNRAAALENLMQKNTDQTMIAINKIYQQASEMMTKRINKVFTRYVTGGKLNPEYAKQLLNEKQTRQYRNKLKKLLVQTEDEKLRREIINTLDAPAYANRISRLQALRDNLYYEARAIGAKEVQLAENRIVNVYEQSYYRTIYADQKNSGLYDFDIITDDKIKKMLSYNWQGGNYSSRIWNNNKEFADKVAETIEIGCLGGFSLDEMCSELKSHVIGDTSDKAQRFVTSRLIRTEVNYFSNQGTLEGLKAAGFTRYRFIATLDLKTSKQCRSLDLKEFNIDEAVPGVNLPPLHPFCRSVIVPAYENENRAGRTRWARNPVTGKGMKVPADMSYDEWCKQYVLENGLKDISKNDIINKGSESHLEIIIDKFTPCLEDAKTGDVLETIYSLADKSELKNLKGWNFNWLADDLKNAEIYKLQIKGSSDIQGLVALTRFERDKAVYVDIAESAPHNFGENKKYNGVGGHLFAIAAHRSKELGYGGFVFMDAKNKDLVEHYRNTLGATLLGMPHPYRMYIDEDAADKLLKIYTLEQGGN